MTFLDRLERPLARFAIPGLIRYVVVLNVLVFLLLLAVPQYASALVLDREAVLRGEVWRLISWIFLPTTTSPLWMIFYLMSTWWLGESLEATWGTFRLNVYYFLGVFLSTLAAFLLGGSQGNFLLIFSLLLAVATIAPNMEILFFVFPMKLKWVAALGLLFMGFNFLAASLADKAGILVCLGNYFLFFGPSFFRQAKDRRTVQARRAQFDSAKDDSPHLHRCEVCHATELTQPDLDFRVAADGHEYCVWHLPKL